MVNVWKFTLMTKTFFLRYECYFFDNIREIKSDYQSSAMILNLMWLCKMLRSRIFFVCFL